MEDYKQYVEKEEQRRAREFANREKKMKTIMDRMGTVIKRSDEEERARDKILVQQAIKKDQEEVEKDIKLKKAALDKSVELKRSLANQILSREISKKREKEDN